MGTRLLPGKGSACVTTLPRAASWIWPFAKGADSGVPVPSAEQKSGACSPLQVRSAHQTYITASAAAVVTTSTRDVRSAGKREQFYHRGERVAQHSAAALLYWRVRLPGLRPEKEIPISPTQVGDDSVNSLQNKSLTEMEGCF